MKKITLDEFQELPTYEQDEIIFSIGRFVDSHLGRDQVSVLYAVEMFFVELEYDWIGKSVTGKDAFQSSEKIDKYCAL